MTSTLPNGTLGSVAYLLAATLYQGNSDRNHIGVFVQLMIVNIVNIGVFVQLVYRQYECVIVGFSSFHQRWVNFDKTTVGIRLFPPTLGLNI